jgi:phosphate/sulfate permease
MKKSTRYWIIAAILGIAWVNEMIWLDASFKVCIAVVINTLIAMAAAGFTALHYHHKKE